MADKPTIREYAIYFFKLCRSNFIMLWIMTALYAYGVMDRGTRLLSLSTENSIKVFSTPLKVKTIMREELIEFQREYSLAFREYGVSATKTIKIFEANYIDSDLISSVSYTVLPFFSKIYMSGNTVNPTTNGGTNFGIQKYFDALKTTTGHCRKLARMGGEATCQENFGDENNMDGNKLICMAPDFEIGSRKFQDCLVLSFGVHGDTSFDETIANLKCQVHMYDKHNYMKEYLENDQNIHFHKMGLDTKRSQKIYLKDKITIDYDSLVNIAANLGLRDQLINVLKIDIEGQEWEVLHDLSQKTFLNSIGQIAVEVHSLDLLELSHEEKLKNTEYWVEAIEALEERGFRRVAYWDNVQPKFIYTDSDGTQYPTAGELLLVNYNWHNESFREEARKIGYKLDLT